MNKAIAQVLKSFGYALEGIWFALKTQRNARLHVLAMIIVCTLGIGFHLDSNNWCWLTICFMLVCSAELMNTAFEHLCDAVVPEFHHSVKRAKDIAAGAVLVCAIGAAIIGLVQFWPYLTSPAP